MIEHTQYMYVCAYRVEVLWTPAGPGPSEFLGGSEAGQLKGSARGGGTGVLATYCGSSFQR